MPEVADKQTDAIPTTGLRALTHCPELEVRQDEDGSGGVTFSGYAIRWGEEAEINSFFFSFIEKWQRGSCKKSIAERGPQGNGQIKVSRQHDTMMGFPRALAAKLTELKEDSVGLRFTAETISTSTGLDLAEELRSGVVDTVSLEFDAIRVEWDNETDTRTILEARLYGISPVNWPAFDGSTIDSVRALGELNGWLEALATQVREGKVLSAANRERLAGARDRIDQVIDSAGGDEPEPDDEPLAGDARQYTENTEEHSSDATLELELALRERELELTQSQA